MIDWTAEFLNWSSPTYQTDVQVKRGRGRPRGPVRKEPGPRELAMKARYEAGDTLETIGSEHGITRERVHQLLTKHFGFTAKSGGSHKKMKVARRARSGARDTRFIRKWGHTFREHQRLVEMGRQMMLGGCTRERTPVGAFVRQRTTAQGRGIAFHFTLADWWAFWQESGKWNERRRGNGFVMCRFDDTGPYSRANCYIATSQQNLRDYHERRRASLIVQEVPFQ